MKIMWTFKLQYEHFLESLRKPTEGSSAAEYRTQEGSLKIQPQWWKFNS